MYHTTRERVASLTETAGSSCAVCHSRMNSLGYPFENFDSLGRQRTVEQIFTSATGAAVATLPIDTRSPASDIAAAPIPVADSVQLSQALGTSDRAIMCFAQHVKSFDTRSDITPNDACLLNAGLKTMYGASGQQGSIKESIKSYILSDDFKIWSY
jgi:hypothetical protein